jgi:imidazolonepropionase-like amidohydrolase
LIENAKIKSVGKAADVQIPDGWKALDAAVVTPGLIDAHSTVGLSGLYNQRHDSDQLERSSPIQPELRALDAYNSQEPLIAYVRSFGVTTLHTGHAPGELISGQTIIVKTSGNTVEEALVRAPGAIAATLSPWAFKGDNKSPGTRGKMMAMLRAELIKAQEYVRKHSSESQPPASAPARDLRLEALGRVLSGEVPLMITANRSQDVDSVLRLADEFKIRVWLDSAAEAYVLIDQIKRAGIPVLIHPTMFRAVGETENLSFETAGKLVRAGIPVALQAGYESYVPKTRVVLFEAGVAAANGLTFDQALAAITIESARILGIADRVGSLDVGKDADLALYDGDPFEYTSRCVGTVVNGVHASDKPR